MYRPNDTMPSLTPRERAVYDRAVSQVLARKANGQAYPQHVGPWERPEYEIRQRRTAA